MTIERFEARKHELLKQRDIVIANLTAIDGALQLLNEQIAEETASLLPTQDIEQESGK